MSKNKEWTERELKELQQSWEMYATCQAKMTFNCYGGQLLGLMMVLKLFTKEEGAPSVLADCINHLLEQYRKDVVKKYPGVQLIDFDDPVKYLYAMALAEQEEITPIFSAELPEILNAIEQLIKEEL